MGYAPRNKKLVRLRQQLPESGPVSTVNTVCYNIMLITHAFVFRAFGNRAGLLALSGSIAFKAFGVIRIFPAALAGRARGVVFSLRFLGHVIFLLLELCYALSLALT